VDNETRDVSADVEMTSRLRYAKTTADRNALRPAKEVTSTMKPVQLKPLHVPMGALVSAAIIAGCNSAGQSIAGVSPLGQQPSSRSQSIRRADLISTTVKIFNQENGTLTSAAVVPSCWTVSPSPIPTVSASPGHSPVITETYDTTCASHIATVLKYTLVAPYTCDFTTTVNPSGSAEGFSYSAMGEGPEDNCFATAAPSGANYDEKFVYTVILGPNHTRARPSFAKVTNAQGHVRRQVNSGVSVTLVNALGGKSATNFYTTQNCGEFPFTPDGGLISYGVPVNLTQTGNDCFAPPSYTYITVGPTRLAEDCSLNITSGTGGGSTFAFSVIDAGSDTNCSVSPTTGLSTTLTWNLKSPR
jgi:hypothetical protein